uniref:hypothetical protein n=1 Tax=Marinobacterium profundum TaxID=1714300 RepID=UPI000830BB70|nr:hypothetical protein [Marinobacterium profundum]
MSKQRFISGGVRAGLFGMALALPFAAQAEEPQVINLTQTGCQFVESENGVDHGYSTSSKADCETINGQSGEERLAGAKPLELKPGRYIFRVSNENVPYELGFWLRGATLVDRALLPSVSGGGLAQGTTRDYEVELKAGEYHYSCPLNPTPNYSLVVKG